MDLLYGSSHEYTARRVLWVSRLSSNFCYASAQHPVRGTPRTHLHKSRQRNQQHVHLGQLVQYPLRIRIARLLVVRPKLRLSFENADHQRPILREESSSLLHGLLVLRSATEHHGRDDAQDGEAELVESFKGLGVIDFYACEWIMRLRNEES